MCRSYGDVRQGAPPADDRGAPPTGHGMMRNSRLPRVFESWGLEGGHRPCEGTLAQTSMDCICVKRIMRY